MNYYTAVSPFQLVAVSVCRRSGLLLIAVSPLWFVAVLTIDRCEQVFDVSEAPVINHVIGMHDATTATLLRSTSPTISIKQRRHSLLYLQQDL